MTSVPTTWLHVAMSFELRECVPAVPPLKIIDVGAMLIGEGKEPYARLVAATPCEVIGFEPQPTECVRLNAMQRPGHTYLPHFIGDGTEQTFYECNYSPTSSLFEPNTPLLDLFQNLGEVTRVVRTSKVQTTRLDDLPSVADADLLKVDVQGGEAMVFEGATNVLKNVVLIHTEVEFAPLYLRQPLFSDIDQMLRRRGFIFHRFTGLAGRSLKPVVVNNDVNAAISQALWAEAVFVKDFMHLDRLTDVQLLKLATILHYNYQSIDLAAFALRHYDLIRGTQIEPRYLQLLASATPKRQ